MNIRTSIILLAALSSSVLPSCIWQPIMQQFTRDTYPGTRPPMVIADVNGKPASENWLKIDDTMLPPAAHMTSDIKRASDGIPYGIHSEYSDIVISPYEPHYQLDYTDIPVGSKVWDPYTRKPFYISRTYTFN